MSRLVPLLSNLVPHCTLLLTLAIGGCGDDNPAAPSATGGNAGNPSAQGGHNAAGGPSGGHADLGGGAGTAGTGAIDPGLPLLDRPATLGYDCAVSTPVKLLQIPSGGVVFDGFATSGQASYLARAQPSSSWGPANVLNVSTLSAGAAVGTVTTIKEVAAGYYSDVSLFAANSKLFLFAVETVEASTRIVYARLSAEGAVEVPLTQVTSIGGSGSASGLVVAPTTDGFGLLWSTTNDDSTDIDFGIMRFDGTFQNPTGVVASAANYIVPSALVATNEGFLASYTQAGIGVGGGYARAIATDGSVGEATTLVTTDNYAIATRHSFLWHGNEALLAWSLTEGTWDDEQLGSSIILTRLGADAKRVANDLRVSAWVRSQENRDPTLFARGGDVGLVWSQGRVIYVCAGCMPDNHLEFALFDGTTFTPKSALLSMTNPAPQGGLVSPVVAQQGNDIITASVVGYHTTSELAAGTFTCTAR